MKTLAALATTAAVAFFAVPAAAQDPALDQAYKDDVECAVLYMAVAAQGEDPAGAALGFYYFIGRLEGRRPDVEWRSHVLTVAADAGGELLERSGERCGQLLIDNGRAMGTVDATIDRWSRGEGEMGRRLRAQREQSAEAE
ncbi:MAG: hypothetical protein K2X07_02055 [Caulobacteraceae bacterium]|nr:hypothetical protein [Caulobacteraceae bacterium]